MCKHLGDLHFTYGQCCVRKKCRKLFLVSTRTEKAAGIAVITYIYFNHQLQAANLAIKPILVGMENTRLQNKRGNFGVCRCFPVYIL